MKSARQTIVALLTAFFYVAGGMLIEISHHDQTQWVVAANPLLEQHSCGAVERHVEWNHSQHCLACSHFAQRFSTETKVHSILNLAVAFIAPLPSHVTQTPDTDVLFSGKRGPPAA